MVPEPPVTPDVEKYAEYLMFTVVNDGRRAAMDGQPRNSNPYSVADLASSLKRTVWDAGWIYMNGLPKKD